MTSFLRALTAGCALIAGLLCVSAGVAEAAGGATLFRLFLKDGSSLVSYGEFARIEDQVIFSMPVGGDSEQPRLYVVSLPASRVDWARSDQYATSARSQWYAAARGEDDFAALSSEVARVLNEVALATDRRRGLEMAERARQLLADWPRTHFGYRQAEVREIVALVDEAISDLRATLGIDRFDLALVADAPDVPLEPLLGTPGPKEQLDQIFRVAALTERAPDRVALLHAGVALIAEAGAVFPKEEAARLRAFAERQIRQEAEVDAAYARLSQRTMLTANRAAAEARIDDVERVLADIARQDGRLGGRRPEAVQALRASVQAQLESARRLRLLRDQWQVRRALYRDYQRSVGTLLLQLARAQPALEAIRRLDGPSPDMLVSLKRRLTGGADRLQRIGVNVPGDLRGPNDLLAGAWRFAEKAVDTRYEAVASGNVATAWQASSAAAGALLMLSRAQSEIQRLLEPPRLQ